MPTALEQRFQNPTGPKSGEVTCIGVTTGSVHIDLATPSYAIKSALQQGEIITLSADGDVWFMWSLKTTGDTVDGAAAELGTSAGTAAQQCGIVYAGERLPERPPKGCQGIVVKAPVACLLRMYVGSRPDL